MGSVAEEVLREELPDYRVVRYTVPGIKDLPGAARRLIDMGCDGVITLGWVGATQVDKYSYIAMSVGLVMLSVLTGKVVVDVTVHEDETEDPRELREIAVNRARAHAENLVKLLTGGLEALRPLAGQGVRQGRSSVGPL
ncbi:riboflavin synthase [Acidilobus sp. 7A]|uniref:riboflavin synthase n=1 Tax=Acidilobus sp. 7A TaxID=1577685 RepID=UPI003184353A